jgi:hypothetical protein
LPLGKDEDDAAYFSRLAQAVSASTKEAFDAMPAAAQTWFDETADALSEGRQLMPPEGYNRDFFAPVKEHKPVMMRPVANRPSAAAAEAAETAAVETEAEADEPAVDEDEPETVVDEPPKAARKRVARGVAAAPVPTRGRVRKAASPPVVDGPVSIATRTRQLVIANEKASPDEILKMLRDEGIDMTERRQTVTAVRYVTLLTLRLAREAGKMR